ncbi:Ni/Fe-hydrogenase cytochrome b subunit [bacterium]|nr:MAG: Ni/Fe-hydrogenase cytochrome b subunit [bacterium]
MTHRPTPLDAPFFTKGTVALSVLAAAGMAVMGVRLLFGLGAVTNLSNAYPWGVWIGVDVAGGVALAAGGFTTAALAHVMHKERYEALVRPALLTAMLGYTFVAFGVAMDIGRWYNIWHPLVMWNGRSALFEVGICVTIYLNVLYVEFLPVVAERFIGRVSLPGPLARWDALVDRLLRALDRGLSATMFSFILLGIVLSTLHQSSLGTLMVIAGPKMHPLWQTPILPLLFLLSAVSVGFPMVIVESLAASRSFGLKPEMNLLGELGRMTVPLLGVTLAFRLGDMFVRESFVYLREPSVPAVLFCCELLFGLVVPMRMLASRAVRESPPLLFTAAGLVVGGVLLNRIDNFIVAYTPAVAAPRYVPSPWEVLATLGCAATLILLYRAAVLVFPVVSRPAPGQGARTKYAVRV